MSVEDTSCEWPSEMQRIQTAAQCAYPMASQNSISSGAIETKDEERSRDGTEEARLIIIIIIIILIFELPKLIAVNSCHRDRLCNNILFALGYIIIFHMIRYRRVYSNSEGCIGTGGEKENELQENQNKPRGRDLKK